MHAQKAGQYQEGRNARTLVNLLVRYPAAAATSVARRTGRANRMLNTITAPRAAETRPGQSRITREEGPGGAYFVFAMPIRRWFPTAAASQVLSREA
jgi:hypothetical protein